MIDENRLFLQKVEDASVCTLPVSDVLEQLTENHTRIGFCRFVSWRACVAEAINRFSYLRTRNYLVIDLLVQFL